MKLLQRLLEGSRFKKNFIKVFQANILSQVILLACTPILTRLFTPEHFGVAAVFTSLLSVTAAVCTWRFDKAVPNNYSYYVGSSLIAAGGIFLAVYCLLVYLIILAHPPVIDQWNGIAKLGPLLYFLPVALLFSGLRQLFQAWFIRKSEMEPISNARIIYTVAYLLGAISCALLGLEYYGLIAGNVIGLCICVIALSRKLGDLFGFLKKQTPSRIAIPAWKAASFTTQASGVSFVNMLSLATSVVLLAQMYSADELGQYSLMSSIVVVPITTITQALALSFWSRAAELSRVHQYAKLKKLYHKLLLGLFLFSIPVALMCMLGRFYIVPILGEQWSNAYQVLIALIPMIVGITLFSATNHLVVLKMQNLQIYADALRILLMIAAIYLAQKFQWSFVTAVVAMSVSSFIGHFSLYICHLIAYRKIAAR